MARTTKTTVKPDTAESERIEAEAAAETTDVVADEPKPKRARRASSRTTTTSAAAKRDAAKDDAAKAKQAEKDAAELAAFTADVKRLSDQGMNVEQVAAELGARPNKVYKVRVALGIRRATRGGFNLASVEPVERANLNDALDVIEKAAAGHGVSAATLVKALVAAKK